MEPMKWGRAAILKRRLWSCSQHRSIHYHMIVVVVVVVLFLFFETMLYRNPTLYQTAKQSGFNVTRFCCLYI